METKIDLIEKQPEIAENIDSLYGEGKRFAGVVLSTGGGKSFLAMDQIIKTVNSHNQRTNFVPEEDSPVLSDCSILYFSPTHIVNGQFRTHMTKYIIAPEYLANERNKNGAITRENATETMFKVLEKMGIEIDDKEKQVLTDTLLKEILTNSNPNKTVESIVLNVIQDKLEKCTKKQKEAAVKKAFPNLHFRAYKNLEKVQDDPDEMADEIEQEDFDINALKPELVILDEAHRTGADTWWKKLQKYLERNKQTRVLAITATPERDVDQMNMMKEISGIKGMGYTTRERRQKKYLAGNYPLLEAIKQGMVTPPEVVHFDMNLDETTEFRTMLRNYVLANINLLKQPKQRGNYTQAFINAQQRVADTDAALRQALILIMKNPFEDDLEQTTEKIVGARTRPFGEMDKIGLIGELRNHIREAYNNRQVTGDTKANSAEMEQLIDSCFDFIQDYTWEDGKKWSQVKAERVSETIERKLIECELEHGKALTFIESMPAGKYKDKTEKRQAAQKYVQEKIKQIKAIIGKIKGVEPEVSALHSAAYTPAQNDEILQKFVESSNEKGPLKVIAAVQKFDEGYHPEGVSLEFMIKEIAENKEKSGEPRIVLLQELGRVISAKKGARTIIFDIANNFIRNHNKFLEEQEEGLECFDFLKLSPEEEAFLGNTETRTNTVRQDIDNTIRIMSILMKNMPNTQAIKKGMTLSELINEQFINEEARERLLDELFLEGIELDDFADFNIGDNLELVRDKVFNKDKLLSGPLAKLTIADLKNLGIIDLTSKKQIEAMRRADFINSEGFVIGGNIDGIYRMNVFTGTQLDGPEKDDTSVDYYGCRPKRDAKGEIIGYFDAAGYDRYGFNEQGIHKVTGQEFDERGFKKNPDGSWTNIYQTDPEKAGVDLQGFNHDGINPETGFDRDGFWHDQNPDGTFKESRNKYALKGPDKGLDVHGFNSKGWFRGQKKVYMNYDGFYFDGTMDNSHKSRSKNDNMYYNLKGFDIDGYRRNGFNKEGIYIHTGTRYNLEGRDVDGNVDNRLTEGRRLLRKIKSNRSINIDNKSPEEIGRILMQTISMERVYSGLSPQDPETMKYMFNEIGMKNESLLNEIFDLPSGVQGLTIREVFERFNDDLIRSNMFYSRKAQQAKEKSTGRERYYRSLLGKINPIHRPSNDDFTR